MSADLQQSSNHIRNQGTYQVKINNVFIYLNLLQTLNTKTKMIVSNIFKQLENKTAK